MNIDKGELALSESNSWGVRDQEQQGFRPRAGGTPWPLRFPLDWRADPFQDRNWCFHLHALRMIDPYLQQYFRLPDPALLHSACMFVTDWDSFHCTQKSEAAFSWYDMAAGLRALRIGFLYNEAKKQRWNPTALVLTMLERLIDLHAQRLQEESYISLNNHGVFQVFGLAMLAEVAPDRASCANAHAFAAKMLERILERQFTNEGVHRENSPYYHIFTLRHIKSLGGVAKFHSKHLEQLLGQAERMDPWMVFPDGQIAMVGDSEARFKGLRLRLENTTASRTALASGEEICIGPFWRSGYGVVQTPPGTPLERSSMLFVMGMFHQSTHKHADDLSFELFEYGRKLIIDGGKFTYNNDGWRKYFISDVAHSTVGLRDQPLSVERAKPYGTALVEPLVEGDTIVIEGEVARPRFRHRRRFVYRPGRRLRIIDTLTSDLTNDYVSRLLFDPALSLSVTGNVATVELPDDIRMTIVCEDPDAQLRCFRGEEDPPRGWASSAFMKREPCSLLEATCTGKTRTMTWNISFVGNESKRPQE